MKTKITYLLFLIPLLNFAQGPFNFNTAGSVEGFVAGSTGETTASAASILSQSGTDLRVEFATGQTKSPTISNPSAGINADTNNFIEIRLKNLGTASYLRVGPNTGGSYANVVISTNDTDYKTYVIDVTAWSGPAVGINLFFKLNSGSTGGANYKPSAAEYMLIDYIKPLAFVATPEVNTFNFTTTAEGFDKTTRATAVPASESGNAILQVKYVSGSNNALAAVVGLNSTIAHVEGSNKYAHITLKNTTTNNEFQLKGKVGTGTPAFSPFQTFTTNDANYKTYDFDLRTWDIGYQFPELNVAVKDTWSATVTYAIGNIVISGNTYYKNLTGTNSTSPSVDTVNWVISNSAGVPVASNWSDTATYATNDIVIYNNLYYYYKSTTSGNSTSPAVPSSDTAKWATGLIFGNALDMTNSIYIDSIVFDNTAPVTPEVNVFNFNSTNEGFTTLTRATAVQATESSKGTLQVNCTTKAATSAIIALAAVTAHVEGTNKYAHITLKNTSTNNSFTLRGYVGLVNTIFSPTTTFTSDDSDYTTYDFDLTSWNDGYQQPELLIGNKDTWSATPAVPYVAGDIVILQNTYYKSLTGVNVLDAATLKADTVNWVICDSTGAIAPAVGAIVGSLMDIVNPIYIDQIVFDNVAPVLGTTDFGYANNTISLYPNPAQEVLNLNSADQIAKMEVYDLLGKKVASNNNAKNVNVAALEKGVYIVKVVKENGSVVAKRFIKQ